MRHARSARQALFAGTLHGPALWPMTAPLPEADRHVDDFLGPVQPDNDIAQLYLINDFLEPTHALEALHQVLARENVTLLEHDPPTQHFISGVLIAEEFHPSNPILIRYRFVNQRGLLSG